MHPHVSSSQEYRSHRGVTYGNAQAFCRLAAGVFFLLDAFRLPEELALVVAFFLGAALSLGAAFFLVHCSGLLFFFVTVHDNLYCTNCTN